MSELPPTESTTEPMETRQHSSPGALDRMFQWIERLPFPYPLFCLGIFVIATALHQGINVLTMGDFFWSIQMNSILNAYIMAYSLALILFVQRSARQSLRTFAPALNLDTVQFEQLQSELTHIPTLPALLTGLAVTLSSWIVNPVFASDELRAILLMPSMMVRGMGSSLLTYSMVGILMYSLIRKLWWISRIYGYAKKLDLFSHRTLYAFSTLRARILAGWILLSYPNMLLVDTWRSPAWLSITGVTLCLVLFAFAYTLLHIHQRIKKEKEAVLFQVKQRLLCVFAQIHDQMDSGVFQDIGSRKILMDSLIVERDLINKISTWPWETETLTGFFSLVFLPVGIWLAETLIKKLLSLG